MSLRIAEVNTSTWHYHLVRATTMHPKQGQLVGLCGEAFVGWETEIRLSVWGMKDHLPSRWCEECGKALEAEAGIRGK